MTPEQHYKKSEAYAHHAVRWPGEGSLVHAVLAVAHALLSMQQPPAEEEQEQ